jgi:hypothetical protein
MEKLIKLAKKCYRNIYSLDKHPNWKKILGKDFKTSYHLLAKNDVKNKKILIPTSLGINVGVTPIESLLAIALALRGAEVHVLLCDKVLAACQTCVISGFISDKELADHGPQKNKCNSCFNKAYKMYKSLGIKVHLYSEYITAEDLLSIEEEAKNISMDEIKRYYADDINIGEHVLAGTIRFYANAKWENEKYSEVVLRRYFKAALQTLKIISNVYKDNRFDCAVFHHGIYVPQGIIGGVSRSKNIRVVNWTVAYRKKSFIFSHGDTYHYTLMNEPISNWENINWNDKIEKELMDYLSSRWDGLRDWISFSRNPKKEILDIKKEINIDLSKPSVGMLTNVMWDAQLHYPKNVFTDMLEWIFFTIDYFIKREDLQLIIRIHPAEISGFIPSRQPVISEIMKRYPVLPSNIIIIPPTSRVSTYAIMEKCNSVIIYGTKTGVELTSVGIPVIVAGEAWIRNKGITLDVNSIEEYVALLNKLPLKESVSSAIIERARKYAYHFFFRRMIPLNCLESVPGWPPYKIKINGLSDFSEGKDVGLDVICNGILNGSEFIYPSESLRI